MTDKTFISGVSELIKDCDSYSKPIGLTYNQKSSFPTLWGGIASIIVFWFMVWMFIIFIMRLLSFHIVEVVGYSVDGFENESTNGIYVEDAVMFVAFETGTLPNSDLLRLVNKPQLLQGTHHLDRSFTYDDMGTFEKWTEEDGISFGSDTAMWID